MKKYQELEKQAKEMLAKVEEMQQEIKRLKEEENATELPSWFNRKAAIGFLEHPNCTSLNSAFYWRDTPQGSDYWYEIFASIKRNPKYKVPNEAIIQIQKWVIQSYMEERGV